MCDSVLVKYKHEVTGRWTSTRAALRAASAAGVGMATTTATTRTTEALGPFWSPAVRRALGPFAANATATRPSCARPERLAHG